MNAHTSSARIERSLRQRLLTAYRRDFSSPPERIIVGFSGGPDSLALALLLANLKRAIPSRVTLVHVDHRIRPDSAGDVRRCQDFAESLGLPFEAVRLPGHPQALHPGVGLEEAARRARYLAFAALAGEGGVVALAHQAGDQAETVLLHIMHGAGLTGLAGMQPISEIRVPWWTGNETPARQLLLWRPLLSERREDLLAILERSGLTPLIDESNDDLSLKRNAVRYRLLPVLREIEPSIEDRLGSLARIAHDDDELLGQLSEGAYKDARLTCGGLSVDRLTRLHVAIARRVLRRWLMDSQRLIPTFDRVEALLQLARSGDQAAKVDTGDGLLAGCFGDALRCGPLEELRRLARADARLALPLAGSGVSLSVNGDTIFVSRASYEERVEAARRLSLSGTVSVSTVRAASEPGAGSDRWSDWFRRERVSPWIRNVVQGVAVDGVMWWIPRQGDYDDADGDRLVCVVWSDQERD